ncbi:MAG: hypothetical protein AAFR96_03625 [Planctomycetota bacterium]
MMLKNRLIPLARSLSSPRRRGTILLLVLGALSMVLILTVVYAAVGKGDRTTSRAANVQRDSREVVDRFIENVVSVVGDDVFDVVPDFAEQRLIDLDTSLEPRWSLEVWDAPVSDFSMLSVPSAAFLNVDADLLDLRRFRPSGGHSTVALWPENDFPYAKDPRVAADPFLASIRPTDLGESPDAEGLFTGGANYFDIPYYARALDWHQISNLAPDGRFVNLFYLRETPGIAGSGFDAASLDLTRDPDTLNPRLVLFDDAGQAVQEGDSGYVLGLTGVADYQGEDIDGGVGAAVPDWNVPAHWTMYQRRMARSTAELAREGFNTNEPDQPTFWEYSYADADGDGRLDSRWFELVDASSGVEVPLVGDDTRRYFAAVRVIDLSGLANVNVATDLVEAPTLRERIGQGPHEASLFTLLSLDMHSQAVVGIDLDDEIQDFGGRLPEASYASFFAPLNGSDTQNDYGEFDSDAHIAQGRKAYHRIRQSMLDWQVPGFGEVPVEAAANAVRSADPRDYSPYVSSQADGPRGAEARRNEHTLYGATSIGFAGGGNARSGPFGLSDLIELLTFHGANDPDAFSALEQAMTADNTDSLGSPSRSLLRSDRSLLAEIGVEEVTSTNAELDPAELNFYGRRFTDLRSLLTTVSGARPIRSVATDAAGVREIDSDLRRRRAEPLVLGSVQYELPESGSTDPLEVRRAQNAARNPLVTNGFGLYLDTLAPFLSEFDNGTAWAQSGGLGLGGAGGGGTGPADDISGWSRTLFYGHNGPEVALRVAAHMAVNLRDSADAPFVDGGNGTAPDGVPDGGIDLFEEIDVADPADYARRRDEPTAALLWLVDSDERANAETVLAPLVKVDPTDSQPINEDDIAILDAEALLGAKVLAPDETSTAGGLASQSTPQSTDAMIVYGVEAQPFIAEAFYLNAYWDAPRAQVVENPQSIGPPFVPSGVGEDSDWIADNPLGEYDFNRTGDIINIISNVEANIRGTPNIDGEVRVATGAGGNRDFLFQMLVFQLFNPFDVPVSLDRLYIEFGDWIYFPADDFPDKDILLEPNETKLLIASNPGFSPTGGDVFSPIATRLKAVRQQAQNLQNGQFPLGATGADDWFNDLDLGEDVINSLLRIPAGDVDDFGVAADNGPVILERYSIDGTSQPAFEDLLAVDDSDLYGESNASDTESSNFANRAVLLWWDLGERLDRSALAADSGWRRDDLLADRLTDPAPLSERPTLDQRLNLESDPYTTGTNIPPGEVADALRENDGDYATDAPNGKLAFAEGTPLSIPNLNENKQRSVALWGRIRRFDTSATEAGTGARSSNPLPLPGSFSATPPEAAVEFVQGDEVVRTSPLGALPANALEPQWPNGQPVGDISTIQTANRLVAEVSGTEELDPDELFFDRFSNGEISAINFEARDTLSGLINEVLLPPTNVPTGPLELRFRSFRTPEYGVNGLERYNEDGLGDDAPVFDPREYLSASDAPARPTSPAGPPAEPVPYDAERAVQVPLNGLEFRSRIDGFPQLRTGDLLNVLGVGPYRMPLRNPPGTPDGYPSLTGATQNARILAYSEQWVTLSEILGLSESMRFDLDVINDSNWPDAFEDALSAADKPLLDRGQVRLDEFVPYFDFDVSDGDYNEFVDVVRGLGIPLALGIFDLVQAGGELPERAYGGVREPVTGLININTAPASVLRTLPGIYVDVPEVGDGDATVWASGLLRKDRIASNGGLSTASLNTLINGTADDMTQSGDGGDPRIDVASSLVSYREPAAGGHRLLRQTTAGGLIGGAVAVDVPLNMLPKSILDDTGSSDLRRGVEMLRLPDLNDDDDTEDGEGPGIEALRTALGFRSIGELLAVRAGGGTDPANGRTDRFQYGMDWIARDKRTVGQLFIDASGQPVDPVLSGAGLFGGDADDPSDDVRIVSFDSNMLGDPLLFAPGVDSAEFQVPVTDQIPDDYDEQLIQINMLANAVTTHSDYFAAWMVIHGFEDDDVADLQDDEPMRPSFRARYLLILDRTTVAERGDRPRVLAKLQVPYEPEQRSPVYRPVETAAGP